ncbi:MAG: VOC family protein, partial [Devosia sp.]
LKEIVFESETPSALARFWAQVLDGYAVRAYDDAEIARLAGLGLTPETDPSVMVDGPGPSLCFHHVPGRDYRNNRVHLDVVVADRAGEVRRLREVGASVAREAEGYTVMRDLEGNQFCLVG